jgi:glutathione S-transferase
MLKIWGRRNSSNVRKVLWCAEEIGLPYESIEVGGSHGGTQTPEYQAMNPNGLVPVIEDHGLPLWESNAIVRYLSARYALGTLYAEDPMERAQAEKWMDWSTSRMAPLYRPDLGHHAHRPPTATKRASMPPSCVPVTTWRWPMPPWPAAVAVGRDIRDG